MTSSDRVLLFLVVALWPSQFFADGQIDCGAIEAERLAKNAKAVLDENWTGQSTKPSPSLYPHQWSWDSAFIAMSYSHYNQTRAMTELRSLFAGQWRSGLLPHIVFNPADLSDYFPGPSAWQTNLSNDAPKPPARQTSGIVQPPVHATAVLTVYRHATNATMAKQFLREMVPKLVAWHDYLATERDVDGDGLVYIRHPWESGMDNSPAWDGPLERIVLKPGMVPPYKRSDTSKVDPDQRPTKFMYDRYVYLVSLFYKNNYNETAIRSICPFLVQDVSFNSIWARANFDLARLADLSGLPDAEEIAQMAMSRANATVMAMKRKLWNDNFFYSYDLVGKTLLKRKSCSGFLPLWSVTYPSTKTVTVTVEQAMSLLSQLYSSNFLLPSATVSAAHDIPTGWRGFGVPSLSRNDINFSLVNYWRGPAWINVNFLIGHGCEHLSKDTDFPPSLRGMLASAHDGIRRLSYQLVKQSGYHEYFNIDNGQGLGTGNFSWSAALILLQLHLDCPAEVQIALSPSDLNESTKSKSVNLTLLFTMLAIFVVLLGGTFACWHVQEKQERQRQGQMSFSPKAE